MLVPIVSAQGQLLELACGTGLGYRLCRNSCREFQYTGLDISERMLEQFKKKHPEVSNNLLCRPMNALTALPPSHFNAVIAINMALSFTETPIRTLREAFRILKPDGKLFASFANRWSLRRLARIKSRRAEHFKTRGAEDRGLTTLALTYSRVEIDSIVHRAGFRRITILGQSILGGLLEFPQLWKIEQPSKNALPKD